jgi:hypothetical protein
MGSDVETCEAAGPVEKMAMPDFNLIQWAAMVAAGIEAQSNHLEQQYDDGRSLPGLLYVWDGLTRAIRDKGYFPEFLHQDLDRILKEPVGDDVTI